MMQKATKERMNRISKHLKDDETDLKASISAQLSKWLWNAVARQFDGHASKLFSACCRGLRHVGRRLKIGFGIDWMSLCQHVDKLRSCMNSKSSRP